MPVSCRVLSPIPLRRGSVALPAPLCRVGKSQSQVLAHREIGPRSKELLE
jgi:hypothetical protein